VVVNSRPGKPPLFAIARAILLFEHRADAEPLGTSLIALSRCRDLQASFAVVGVPTDGWAEAATARRNWTGHTAAAKRGGCPGISGWLDDRVGAKAGRCARSACNRAHRRKRLYYAG